MCHIIKCRKGPLYRLLALSLTVHKNLVRIYDVLSDHVWWLRRAHTLMIGVLNLHWWSVLVQGDNLWCLILLGCRYLNLLFKVRVIVLLVEHGNIDGLYLSDLLGVLELSPLLWPIGWLLWDSLCSDDKAALVRFLVCLILKDLFIDNVHDGGPCGRGFVSNCDACFDV